MKSRVYLCYGLFALLLTLLAMPAMAQQVAVELTGQVTDQTGEPLENATVEIVHEPTGTTRFVDAQAGGRFLARGLRPGGPYRVTGYRDGYEPQTVEDVFVNLGEEGFVQIQLPSSSTDLDTLQVVGVAQSLTFQPDNMGSGTTVTRDQIQDFASVSQNLADFVRFDPRVTVIDESTEFGQFTVGGANGRFNNVSIDGVPANDAFGLNSNGQPAVSLPISVEWLDQISVEVTDYDVRQANATGGFINSVTKSGTNEFFGSVYGFYRDDSFIGEDENDNDFPEFEEKRYGANVGGAIIPNRLFFFVGYENFEQDDVSAALVGLRGSGQATIFDLDRSAVEDVITAARGFGFDPGSIEGPGALTLEEEKYVAKLDWQINDQHRASFRWNETEGQIPDVERDNNDFALSSNFFDETREYTGYTAQLFSDWTSTVSSEFRATTTEYTTSFDLFARQPEVLIDTDAGDLLFGAEQFRHANNLAVDTDNVFFNVNYFTGLHSIDIGAEWYNQKYNNLFVFGNLGIYEFSSIDQFLTGVPDEYQLRVSADPNNPDLPRTLWDFSRISFWVQDTWQMTPTFNLQYGVRFDSFTTDDEPLRNERFEDTFGFSNQGTLDGQNVYQPRLGFNWQPDLGMNAQLRGGIGLFTGRQPGVWLSNAFTNPGGTIDVFECDGVEECEAAGVIVNGDPDQQLRIGGTDNAVQDVDVVSDGFQQPTDVKANLAFDMEVSWLADAVFTAEVVHARVSEGIQYEHINLGAPTGTLPDGRNAYWADIADNIGGRSGTRANANDNFNDVLLLRNTGQGERTNVTLSLDKNWSGDWGTLFGRAAYTYGSSSDVNSGTSSRAISNWNNRAVFNPNEEVEATSNYEISNRAIALLNYQANWFSFGATKISAFFEYREGRPYSYVFDNDANGDGISDNDLLFVPANPGDVVFTDPAEEQAFFDFVGRTDDLNEARGSVVKRNSARSPSQTQLDMRFAQEVDFGRFGVGELFLNIENFTNLLNDDWGQIDEVGFEYVAEFVNVRGLTEDGRYIYDLDNNNLGPNGEIDEDSFVRRVDGEGQSRWSAQIGVRFDF